MIIYISELENSDQIPMCPKIVNTVIGLLDKKLKVKRTNMDKTIKLTMDITTTPRGNCKSYFDSYCCVTGVQFNPLSNWGEGDFYPLPLGKNSDSDFFVVMENFFNSSWFFKLKASNTSL